MPSAIPAMRGSFGTIEYWLTTMNVEEFIQRVRFPQDLEDWAGLTLDEKYQRELDINRVRSSIAPYFANDPDRFSGAILIAVRNSQDMEFEALDDLSWGKSNVPGLYKSAAKNIGFLTFQGTETFVPLDGQHRAKAFKYAVDGTDDNNRPILGMHANKDLATDQVAVVLMRWDPQKGRRVFSKINRQAKSPSTITNIIIDDDDALAVMTRELGSGGVIPAHLVSIRSNTLTGAAREFTTLPTLYDATREIILGLGIVGNGKPEGMTAEQREAVTPDVKDVWELLLGSVDLFRESLAEPGPEGDAKRKQIRDDTLLGKPIGQFALVRAFMLMKHRSGGTSDVELCRRLNRIDWRVDNAMWHGVLMNPNGRVMSGKGTVNRAHEFIAHLGGAQLTDDETNRLLEHIHGDDWEIHKLPDPVA